MLEYLDVRLALIEQLPKDSVGAEIGVFKGDFSAELVARARPRKLHLIDPWVSRSDGDYKHARYGSEHHNQSDMDDIYQGVVHRFSDEIRQDRVVLHRKQSEEALSGFADGELDWVYIDGDHTHSAVLSDLRLACRKVRANGYIGGDDYGCEGWWQNGVTSALHQFLAECSDHVVIKSVVDSQFLLWSLPSRGSDVKKARASIGNMARWIWPRRAIGNGRRWPLGRTIDVQTWISP